MAGRELLTLARDLLARAETPPEGVPASVVYRAAVGRAYYATFTAAVAFLSRIGFEVHNSSNAHTHVQYALHNCGSAIVARAASSIRFLSTERRRADYQPADPLIGTHPIAEKCIGTADEALTVLESIPVAELGAIATGVLNWATLAGSTTVTRKGTA